MVSVLKTYGSDLHYANAHCLLMWDDISRLRSNHDPRFRTTDFASTTVSPTVISFKLTFCNCNFSKLAGRSNLDKNWRRCFEERVNILLKCVIGP